MSRSFSPCTPGTRRIFTLPRTQEEHLATFGKGTAAGANKLLSSAMKRVDVAIHIAIRNAVRDLWQGGNMLFEAKN